MTEEKHCEAYFCKEKGGLDKNEKVIIQGIGRTPEEAFDLFVKVKKEMGQ